MPRRRWPVRSRDRRWCGPWPRWSCATSGAARSSRRRPSWRSSPSATCRAASPAHGLDDRAQLALWAVVIVAALVYAIRARGSLPSVTAGLNVFAVVLVVIAGTSIVPYELRRAGRQPIDPRAGAPSPTRPRTHDARHLLPDLRPLRVGRGDPAPVRHHGQRPLRLARGRGFQVPAHSHANYRATDFSLAATLNMRYLDELTQDDRAGLGRPDAGAGDDSRTTRSGGS